MFLVEAAALRQADLTLLFLLSDPRLGTDYGLDPFQDVADLSTQRLFGALGVFVLLDGGTPEGGFFGGREQLYLLLLRVQPLTHALGRRLVVRFRVVEHGLTGVQVFVRGLVVERFQV